MALLTQEEIDRYGALEVPERRFNKSDKPLYSKGLYFCTGIVMISGGNAYVLHSRPTLGDKRAGWPSVDVKLGKTLLDRGDDLTMFALSTFNEDVEAIKRAAERQNVTLAALCQGTYTRVYDEARDDVVMKAEEKDLLVIPAERKIRVYREEGEPLEYRI